MTEEIKTTEQLASVAAVVETCPRCGAILVEGVINNIPLWICPTEGCGYKKLRR